MAKENNFPVSNERASFPIGGDWVNLKDERARKKLEKTVEMFSDNWFNKLSKDRERLEVRNKETRLYSVCKIHNVSKKLGGVKSKEDKLCNSSQLP